MLKKLVLSAYLFPLFLAATLVRAEVMMPSPPSLAAESWVLMDAATGRVLVEHNADEQLPPASLTKMMTSYIVAEEIEQGSIDHDDPVPISVTAWQMGGSKMFVREGTEVSVIDLLRGVIIQSGNDASVALAEFVAGSEDAFADLMNQQASLLGMDNSHFENATGWPAEGHLTTARDLALLARAMIREHPEHYDLYAEKYFEYNGIKQPNRNRLLWRDSSVDGIKTGHTEAAGYCLVASAERDDMRLISVVMGTDSESARARESQKLLSYGFRYYETAQVYSAGDILVEDNRVWYGETDSVDLISGEDVVLTLPRGARESLETKVRVEPALKAPLEAGGEVGRLTVSYQGEQLADSPVVAAETVPEGGFFSRLWDAILLFFHNLF
jgi:D-alanyl-D-alanine carboxypeptidase (penicillin-binding protein 5/6)